MGFRGLRHPLREGRRIQERMLTGHSVRSFLVGGVVACLLILVFVPPLALLHRQDLPLERRFGALAVALVARLQAGGATNPFGAGARVSEPAPAAYIGSCAVCHGPNGDGRGIFGPDTYPNATDLRGEDAKALSDAELFWITKNGLAFTAMPGFASQYADIDIWDLVSYLRALQDGSARPLSIPAPATAQLAFADPRGGAAQRGAAVYFAAGCAACHGPVGDGPADLAIPGRLEILVVREGGRGMPKYGLDRISEIELADLRAYVETFAGR